MRIIMIGPPAVHGFCLGAAARSICCMALRTTSSPGAVPQNRVIRLVIRSQNHHRSIRWPEFPGHEVRGYYTLDKHARYTGIFQRRCSDACRFYILLCPLRGALSERWKILATSRFMYMDLHTLLSS